MAEEIFTNYEDDASSLNLREAALGTILPGVHAGFDTFSEGTPDGTGGVFHIDIDHDITGITKYDLGLSPLGPFGVLVNKHGQIIHTDETIATHIVEFSDSALEKRFDIIYIQHQYIASAGSNATSVGVQKGSNGAGIPTIVNPENKIPIALVEIPATATNFADINIYPIKVPTKNYDSFIESETVSVSSKEIILAPTTKYVKLTYNAGVSLVTYDIYLPELTYGVLGNLIFINILINGTDSDASIINIYEPGGTPVLRKSLSTGGSVDVQFIFFCDGQDWLLVMDNPNDANELKPGIVERANETEGRSGTDSTKYMTSSRVRDALRNGSTFAATSTNKGSVEKATAGEVESGTSDKYPDSLLLKNYTEGKFNEIRPYGVHLTGAVTSPYTIPAGVGKIFCSSLSNNLVITLPSPVTGVVITVTYVSLGVGTLSVEDHNNVQIASITDHDYAIFENNGTDWYVIKMLDVLYPTAIACPFVYANDIYLGEIIKNQKGEIHNEVDILDLTTSVKPGQINEIRISEEKDEVSFFEYLKIFIDGTEISLEKSDFVMRKGENKIYKVDIPKTFNKIILEAKGYYEVIKL